MKSNIKKLIRNVLIGAVASIYHTNAQAADNSTSPLLEGLNGEDKKDAVNALKNKISLIPQHFDLTLFISS